MNPEYNYYREEYELEDGHINIFYIKQGVWQTRPVNAVEITEEEYKRCTDES